MPPDERLDAGVSIGDDAPVGVANCDTVGDWLPLAAPAGSWRPGLAASGRMGRRPTLAREMLASAQGVRSRCGVRPDLAEKHPRAHMTANAQGAQDPKRAANERTRQAPGAFGSVVGECGVRRSFSGSWGARPGQPFTIRSGANRLAFHILQRSEPPSSNTARVEPFNLTKMHTQVRGAADRRTLDGRL